MQQSKIDFAKYKKDFLIFNQESVRPLIYLDSSASAQKPAAVVTAIADFYTKDYANIHRGIYELSARATKLYEDTRVAIKSFINADAAADIVFVRSTTEAINLLATSLSEAYGWQADDEVILSEMEHHSNIVPWYLLKEKLGIQLKVIPVTDEGELDLIAFEKAFSKRTKLVALTHASNVLGTINPLKKMITLAHTHHVPVLVDGAQAIPHMPIDVSDLDCDFYAFSAHKLYGPTGLGVLYAKAALLNQLPPYQGGGEMIETVSFEQVTFANTPARFEAGTPHIAGVIGLKAAIDYLQQIGMQNIFLHEQTLLAFAEQKLSEIADLKIFGTIHPKVGVISFNIKNIHPHDLGTVLDHEGIAIRAGHHCAMPLMKRFNVPAMARISFGIYSDYHDIEQLIAALHTAKRLLT